MTREWTSPDGRMRLINGDCCDLMRGCRDGEFALACVDPPYNLARFANGIGKNDRHTVKTTNANWNNNAPTQDYFDHLWRVACNQIIWGANNFTLPPTEYFCVWDKQQTVDNFASAEYAWVSMGLKMPAKVFTYSIHQHNADKGKIHPTQKPVALYRWLFQNYAKPGDRILDTHVGSASSFIAAWEKGFEIVGCELDGDYFNAAVARIEKAMQQPALPFGTPPQPQHTAQELF